MDLVATPPATAEEDSVRRLELIGQVRPDDLASRLLEFEKEVAWGSCGTGTLDRLEDALDRLGHSEQQTASLRSAILVARDWQDCLGSLTALQVELRRFHVEVENARERRQILPSDLTPELEVLRRIVSRCPEGEDTGTPDKSSTNDPYSRFERDTTTTVHALEARLQPIKASLAMLLLRLDAFGHHAASLMPEAVASAQISYAALCVQHEAASQEFDRLKAEYADDKWLAVWHCVERQVREIIASVNLTLRRLDNTAFRGTLINGPARALAMKREHYTVLVPSLLALLSEGIRSARCRNRDVVQGFRELERAWEDTTVEAEQMTRRIEAARVAGIISADGSDEFARPNLPATPFRKDTSLLPPRSHSRLSSAAFDSPAARPPWNGGTSVRLSNAVSPSKLPARVSTIATPTASRLAMPTQSSLARSVSALPRPSSASSPQKGRPSLARTPTKVRHTTAPRASLLRPPSTPLVSSRRSVVPPQIPTPSPARTADRPLRPKSSLGSHASQQHVISTPMRPVLKPLRPDVAARTSNIPLPSPMVKRVGKTPARGIAE